MPPLPESEQNDEIMFEVRHQGQRLSVTKNRLFELAKTGAVLPDDVITVAGTKVFADTIHGIVFGKASSTVAPPTDSETQNFDTDEVEVPFVSAHDPSECYESEKNAAASTPFDVSHEPHVQVDRLPGARSERKFTDLGKSLEEPLSQASTWVRANITRRHIAIAGSALASLCLLGVLVYWFMPKDKSLCGAVRIAGTLKLDGKPVAGASVILHPRNTQDGRSARGTTNRSGWFTVTTGADPIGCGAIPGEYDVTVLMRPEIPRTYEDPKTSGLALRVESSGNKPFNFELSSVPKGPPRTATSPGAERARQQQAQEAAKREAREAAKREAQEAVKRRAQEAAEREAQEVAKREAQEAAKRQQLAQEAKEKRERQRLAQEAEKRKQQRLAQEAAEREAEKQRERQRLAREAEERAKQQQEKALPSSIFDAATSGVLRDVEQFVKENAKLVHARDHFDNTPLHWAATTNSNVAVVEFLLSVDADINAKNREGNTPLHCAAQDNRSADLKVLKYLIDRGADVKAKNNAGKTPENIAPTPDKRRVLSAAEKK